MTSKRVTKRPASSSAKAVQAQEKPSRGRPRATDIEDRVFDSVMSIYSKGGWAVFTFEALARDAGVGKSSLYRRWSDREQLLRDALQARWLPVHNIDSGTLKGDLRELAQMIFNNRTGDLANLENWFRVDALEYPEVRKATAPFFEATILEARKIVRRAIKRGEVAASVNPGLLMDLVVGGVNNHVLTTPPNMRKMMIEKSSDFLDNLIEAVLHGTSSGNERD